MPNAVESTTSKQPLRPWREAATIVIVSKDDPSATRSRQIEPFDYRILFLQRETRSRSFAGASVFPGGVIDTADFSPKWFNLFGRLGIHTDDDFGWGHMKGKPRAGPIAAPRAEGLLPNDVAFRICAIRETFEESGILLAGKETDIMHSISLMKNKQFVSSTSYCDSMDVKIYSKEWRTRVHEDADEFLNMCIQLGVYPNIWSLFELSTILTPAVTSRRYDTIFYLSSLDTLPYAEVDYKEMIDLKWLNPADGIRMHCRRQIELPVPQMIECARLLDFPKLSDLQGYAADQMDQGMSVAVPVIMKVTDALIELLPGDDCYPPNLSPEDVKSLIQMNESEVENLKRCQNVNRLIFKPDGKFKIICNVTLPHGQHPPRNINSNDWLDESKL